MILFSSIWMAIVTCIIFYLQNLYTYSQDSEGQVSTVSSSQDSSWSQVDEALPLKEIQIADINKAIYVLGQGCISPLRSKLNTNIDEAKDRTIRYYKRKAEETSEALYNAIAP